MKSYREKDVLEYEKNEEMSIEEFQKLLAIRLINKMPYEDLQRIFVFGSIDPREQRWKDYVEKNPGVGLTYHINELDNNMQIECSAHINLP